MSKKKDNYENLEYVSDIDIDIVESDNIEEDVNTIDIDNIVTDTLEQDNIKSCKVIKSISNDKIIIDFDGYGKIVSVENARSFDGKSIDIKYSGEINKSDFKYEVV